MSTRFIATIAVLVLAAVPSASHAVATDCNTAQDAFGKVRDRVGQALRLYAECVRASDGEDVCAREFQRLKAVHQSLENAGNDVHVNCAPE